MKASDWWDCEDVQELWQAVAGTVYSPETERQKTRRLCQAIALPHSCRGAWEGADYPDDPGLWLSGWIQGIMLQPQEVEQRRRAAALLRDIFFPRPILFTAEDSAWKSGEWPEPDTVVLRKDWLTWNGGTVPRLAKACYDARREWSGYLDPDRLRILADGLEEAGCVNPDVLNHLRLDEQRCGWCNGMGYFTRYQSGTQWICPHCGMSGRQPHVLGCWAVEACLGRA